jgi:hypothetical protein
MSTSNNWLFALNPLSLVFLSGFATQFFISLCCNDPKTGYTANHNVKKNTDNRMNKWQICFYNLCINLYQDFSSKYEKKVFENGQTLNPYSVHSSLLVIYSKAILTSFRKSNMGPETVKQIDLWFNIIKGLRNSCLWIKFPEEIKLALLNVTKEYEKYDKSKPKTDGLEFAHFSANTLYIRSMSIVIIHEKQYDSLKTFTEWTRINASHLTVLLQFEVYMKEFEKVITTSKCINNFPYLNYLDCKGLYNSWDRHTQKSLPVPVINMFTQILRNIKTEMEQYQWSLTSLSSTSDDHQDLFISEEVNSDEFLNCLQEIEIAMKNLKEKIQNCEKQSKCHNKKKQKLSIDESHLDLDGKCWTCRFLFPPKEVLFPPVYSNKCFAC